MKMLLLAVLIASLSNSSNRELFFEVDFPVNKVSIKNYGEFSSVSFPECLPSTQKGAPQLPVRVIYVAIPFGTEPKEIEVLPNTSIELPGSYKIYPVQAPQIISNNNTSDFLLDSHIYSSPNPYPTSIVNYTGCGSIGGYRVASFLLYPVQYRPLDKKLFFYPKIKIKASLKPSLTDIPPCHYHSLVKHLVINPEEVEEWTYTPSDTVEYLIITTEEYAPYFETLADWKTKKGVPARVLTLSYINDNYGGHYDTQENIREYIKDAYTNWGTIWVLFGGDVDIVPGRVTPLYISGLPGIPGEEDIICDLYYSGLDGDWDANGNHTYGEPDDNPDMYPDVFVGRACIHNEVEIQTFVSKVLTYEKNPPPDYPLKMLFMAYRLNQMYPISPDPWDASPIKEFIQTLYIPSRFTITKEYSSTGNEGRDVALTDLNAGQNLINHICHSNWDQMGVSNVDWFGMGAEILTTGDMDGLSNQDRQSVLYSIGCWPAAMDYDCVAEHFVNNPDGGGVAFIGNSRYGLFSLTPDNRVDSTTYSTGFDVEFFKSLFADNFYHIGRTLADSKIPFIPLCSDTGYRWVEYCLNLLGEPEMPLWTDTPKSLDVTCPSSIPVGQSTAFKVTVSCEGESLDGALVCVRKEQEIYKRGLTIHGEIEFSILADTEGEIEVTVTAQNCLPYDGTALVGIEEKPEVRSQKTGVRLEVYPNPFTTKTVIVARGFSLAKGDPKRVTLHIYDLSGRLVRSFLINQSTNQLINCITWDGTDNYGNKVKSGIYFCRLETKASTLEVITSLTKKLTLIK